MNDAMPCPEPGTARRRAFRRIASSLAGEYFDVPAELDACIERDGPIAAHKMSADSIAIAALALARSAERPTAQSFVGSLLQQLKIIQALGEHATYYETFQPAPGIAIQLELEEHTFWFASADAILPAGPIWQLRPTQ